MLRAPRGKSCNNGSNIEEAGSDDVVHVDHANQFIPEQQTGRSLGLFDEVFKSCIMRDLLLILVERLSRFAAKKYSGRDFGATKC